MFIVGDPPEVRKMAQFFLLFCAFLMTNYVSGFPKGAPPSACYTLTPRHPGGSVQASYPPYQVLPAAGQGRIRLTLGSPQGLAYEGFIIVARDAQTGEFIGEFSNVPDVAQHLECTPGFKKNAVTHTSTEKKQNLEFEWEAPTDYEGTIIFNSTFLQDYETYWVGVESPRISVLGGSIQVMSTTTPRGFEPALSNPSTPPYYDPGLTSQTATSRISSEDEAFYEGCGKVKNCFGLKAGCIEVKNCDAAVSVLVSGDKYVFELIGRKGKWVAVGLSKDKNMGDDNVVECTNEGGVVGFHMSQNKGRTNIRIRTPEGSIRLLESSIQDDVIRCKFVRAEETRIDGQEYNLAKEAYNLLLAAGSGLKDRGIDYHDIGRSASESKSLADVGQFVEASDLYIRIHGGLMLASWIGTASIGILLARYYRQTWVNSQFCGKDQWFAWHRFFMFCTWLMTIAAFVLIFIEIGEWSSQTIHASLGVATTVLCFIQPFMAAMRPHPGAPKRPLFNWIHWLVGNLAHICAIVAIFFAVRLTKAKMPDWVDWILTAYVVFHVLTHLILTFAGCASDRQDNLRINAFPMKDMHIRTSMGHPDARRDAPHTGFRRIIFGVYAFVIVLFAIALIVITVLAPIEDSWNSFTDMVTK